MDDVELLGWKGLGGWGKWRTVAHCSRTDGPDTNQ